MRDFGLYIKDIIKAMNAITEFVKGMGFDDFKHDDKTASAVIRKFEIIGEATKNIPEFIRGKYPDIPWKEMAGMRDKLIHFYFGDKLSHIMAGHPKQNSTSTEGIIQNPGRHQRLSLL